MAPKSDKVLRDYWKAAQERWYAKPGNREKKYAYQQLIRAKHAAAKAEIARLEREVEKQKAEAAAPVDEIPEPPQVLSLANIAEYFSILFTRGQLHIQESTMKTHISNLKKVITITDAGDELKRKLKNSTKVIKQLNDAVSNEGTKRLLAHSICKLIDVFKLNNVVDKQPYKVWADELGIVVVQQQKERRENSSVPTLHDLLVAVNNKFGNESKQYLLTVLYGEIPARDNFGNLIIKSQIGPADETRESGNYIVQNRSHRYTIVLNNFKTRGDKFSRQIIPLSKKVCDLIRAYQERNNIGLGDALFGKANLSQFVSKFISQLGLELAPTDRGIGLFRKVAESDAANKSPAERARVAQLLMHSPAAAAQSYVREGGRGGKRGKN